MGGNTVSIIGNCTRDGEIHYFNDGGAAVKFDFCWTAWSKKGEEWKEDPMFFTAKYAAKDAEAKHAKLLKGTRVCVEGELRQEKWQSEGQQRSKVVIKAHAVTILNAPSGNRQGGNGGQVAGQSYVANGGGSERSEGQEMAGVHSDDAELFGDNIPF